MLNGMGVEGYYADGGSPLVVLLMDVLVDTRMVQKPTKNTCVIERFCELKGLSNT